MGARANYVRIENGQAKAYYDSWGGTYCVYAVDLGPPKCQEVIGFSEETDELMDWAFAEGGFLLDYDEKRCIFFGLLEYEDNEDEDPVDLAAIKAFDAELRKGPAALFEFVAVSWPGGRLSGMTAVSTRSLITWPGGESRRSRRSRTRLRSRRWRQPSSGESGRENHSSTGA